MKRCLTINIFVLLLVNQSLSTKHCIYLNSECHYLTSTSSQLNQSEVTNQQQGIVQKDQQRDPLTIVLQENQSVVEIVPFSESEGQQTDQQNYDSTQKDQLYQESKEKINQHQLSHRQDQPIIKQQKLYQDELSDQPNQVFVDQPYQLSGQPYQLTVDYDQRPKVTYDNIADKRSDHNEDQYDTNTSREEEEYYNIAYYKQQDQNEEQYNTISDTLAYQNKVFYTPIIDRPVDRHHRITHKQEESSSLHDAFDIPKPMVADVVLGMGATAGETLLTYLYIIPLNGDPAILSLESEIAYLDGAAAGIALEYKGTDLEYLRAGQQLTLDINPEKAEGTLSTLGVRVQEPSIETFKSYIRADIFNSVFSNIFYAGVRLNTAFNLEEVVAGGIIVHESLFMTVSERVTFAIEFNLFYNVVARSLSLRVHPQIHLNFGERFAVLLGVGLVYERERLVPEFVHRVLVISEVP